MKFVLIVFIFAYPIIYLNAGITTYCDIPTGNIESITVTTPEACLSLCEKKTACAAATFISGWNKCFLKNTNKKILGVRFYSGIIDRSNEMKVIEEGYDIDYPVGDIKKIDGLKNHNDCKETCLKEPDCRAFSFIERYNSCWLKNRHNKKQIKIFYCLEK